MKILVTSFGPFNNFNTNPSNQIMLRLKERINLYSPTLDYFTFETIDVSWRSVSEFIDAKKNEVFDIIIHLGVASNENKLRIETCGQNIQSGMDIENISPNGHEIIKNESNLNTNISIEILNDFVAKNEYVSISMDAGSYLCNYLYYNSLYFLGKKSLVLFIHTADTQNQPTAPNIDYQSEIILKLIDILTNKTPYNIA
jgi:pyrrolidone-carboxylate peptidase